MYASSRRIQVLTRCLRKPQLALNNVRAYISSNTVSIGEIVKDVKETNLPQYVPKNYYNDNANQTTLHHLRWMMQKDILKQDIFLLGPPGPRRRNIALQYLELTNREHEYVALSRDTTESDLKQRREIQQGTALYFDQSAVRAAIEGRVLILEGIEKAERNVLPVLNNLLENREMYLEDGRLLIPAERYDKLLEKYSKDDLDKWKLVRVNEDFRVIALGLPVPKYRGNPLDPPLRSRFQARDVNVNNYQEWLHELKTLAPNAPQDKIEQLLSVAFGMLSKEASTLGMPDFPIDNLPRIVKVLESNPDLSVYNLLYRIYPYHMFMKDGTKQVEDLWQSFQVSPAVTESPSITDKLKIFLARMPKPSDLHGIAETYIPTDYQNQLLGDILQTYAVSDFCIVGSRGCGKSILVNKIAESLGKQVESIVLYQDMTSRDLIQQRTTLDNGDTVWKLSPLIEAALEGKIAVLDGLHRIHPSTLSVLHRLVHDREIQLHDGKRLVSAKRAELLRTQFGVSDRQLAESGVLRIHPDFRVIAIADPPQLHAGVNWLSPEVLSLFVFHAVRPLSMQEEMHIMTSKYGPISKPLHQIITLAHVLRDNPDQTLRNLAGHLSTRQLLRIAARMAKYPTDDAYDTVEKTFMIKFLPSLARDALEKTMAKVGIERTDDLQDKPITWNVSGDTVTIGQTNIKLYKTDAHTKVPNVLFYDVPQHINLMERLLQDFQLGYHLLLVGNQGVGKNKIVDRFLQMLNRPREYIQLHRDTTVQTLTIQPTVRDGLLVHEDSPLVKAIKEGHVLVIDEADKAPTHVTCILKTLVETGRMILSDGRRIVKTDDDFGPNCIKTHPDFRIIVLANRPGFPFLGNDFFGSLGDLFSSHAVDNPSRQSEIDMLQQYGPNVPQDIVKRLVAVFGELRNLADQGLVNYPYSTREVVNIVKHLQKFPGADLEDVVFNVFDFDRYNPEIVDTVGQILFKHGFSSQNVFASEYIKSKRAKEYLQVTKERTSGLDTSGPKHGKVDEKNEPHVGGNTWAGGTGGRDTAGLGGKGGPYRLDAGHEVHQLSDAEKAAVPEHIQRAAREMGKKAFEAKLKEIGMSGYDAHLYTQFSNAVSRQVQSMRMILETLQAKNKERQWNRHQTTGELDDVKLIDGILGEKNIYRRRTENDPELGTPQMKPKHFRLVVDVSGSMYRFNSYDGRLDRELEAVVLVMEAFEGFDDKIQYDIIGHSGETDKIEFVKKGAPPKDNKERLDIIRVMHAHSQYCWSGDNTLEATELAVNSLVDEDSDENIVVVLSDANLSRYGIPAARLGKALTAQNKVNAYAIFIGSLGDQAERLVANLPAGHGYVCTDLTKLPQILKQIFASSLMSLSDS